MLEIAIWIKLWLIFSYCPISADHLIIAVITSLHTPTIIFVTFILQLIKPNKFCFEKSASFYFSSLEIAAAKRIIKLGISPYLCMESWA
jgi:hypothetical protein